MDHGEWPHGDNLARTILNATCEQRRCADQRSVPGRGCLTSEVHIVAVTNDDPLHSAFDAIEGEPHLIDGPGLYEVLGYNITGIGTALSDEEDNRRINTVYVIRSDGVSVCYLGSLERQVECETARLSWRGGRADCIRRSSVEKWDTKEFSRLVNVLGPQDRHTGWRSIGQGRGQRSDEETPLDALLRQMNVERPDPQIRLNVTQTNLPTGDQGSPAPDDLPLGVGADDEAILHCTAPLSQLSE